MQRDIVSWIDRYLQGWPEIAEHDPNAVFDNHAKFDKSITPLIESRLVQQPRPKSPYTITLDGISFVTEHGMTVSNWPDWPVEEQYLTRKAIRNEL